MALTIIPFLASRLLPRASAGKSNAALDRVMGAIHTIYRPALHVALQMPRRTVAAGLAAFFLSLGLIPLLGFSLFPENESPYFLVDIEAPQGAAVSETDRAVQFADAILAEYPEIEWRFANTGRGNPQVYYNEIPPEQLSNLGQIYARFDTWKRREGLITLEEIRAKLDQYPAARIKLRRFTNGPPIEAPIAVRVSGPDLAAIGEIAAEVERLVRATPGARDVSNPSAERLLDLDLNIDDAEAALRGVPAGSIDQNLRIAVGGLGVAQFRDPAGDAFPVVLRAPRSDAMPVSALERLYVWNSEGAATPLGEIASPRLKASAASIDRVQRERTVTITAYAQSGYLTSAVTADVAERLEALSTPPGYTISFGGQAEAQQRSFGGLGPAIMVAIFGVLAVLLLEFGSFAVTAVVAFVIPFGIMGGLIALWIGGELLSFTAIIGFIALIGIEIKNSILLVEFANQARARGMALREAIEQAGEVRFLPVLLDQRHRHRRHDPIAAGGFTAVLAHRHGADRRPDQLNPDRPHRHPGDVSIAGAEGRNARGGLRFSLIAQPCDCILDAAKHKKVQARHIATQLRAEAARQFVDQRLRTNRADKPPHAPSLALQRAQRRADAALHRELQQLRKISGRGRADAHRR